MFLSYSLRVSVFVSRYLLLSLFLFSDSHAVHHFSTFFFFLMIRRPPRSTLDRSSAASDVYKRQQVVQLVFVQAQQVATIELDRPLLDLRRFGQ